MSITSSTLTRAAAVALAMAGVIFILINYSLSRLATWVDQRSVRTS